MTVSKFASCCLLSYERPEFVRQAIISCVENAGYPLEMIVHDDGSNVETEEVLRELRDAGQISLLMLNAPNHNEGQGIGLNRMFAAAKGDPIVKLDQDLRFEPNWLKQCVALLEANDRAVRRNRHAPSSDVRSTPRIGALGLFKVVTDLNWQEKAFIETWKTDDIEWEEHTDFVGSAIVIPRIAWNEFGPFEERSATFAEDEIFKRSIRTRPTWCNALFPADLATNIGVGIGPSTINVLGPDGEPMQSAIMDGPRVLIGQPPPGPSGFEIERPSAARPSKIWGERIEMPTPAGRAPRSLAA